MHFENLGAVGRNIAVGTMEGAVLLGRGRLSFAVGIHGSDFGEMLFAVDVEVVGCLVRRDDGANRARYRRRRIAVFLLLNFVQVLLALL